jgi:ribonuclease T1
VSCDPHRPLSRSRGPSLGRPPRPPLGRPPGRSLGPSPGRLVALVGLLGLLGALLVGCSVGTATSAGTATSTAQSAAGSRSAPAGCPAPSATAPGAKESRLPVRSLCALPVQAAQVWQTIQSGGKLTYSRDGIVFNNAEHLLPAHTRGYYHEYTVPTPGSRDRGTRRLIAGQSHEVYYTGDHYVSFVVVDTTAVAGG